MTVNNTIFDLEDARQRTSYLISLTLDVTLELVDWLDESELFYLMVESHIYLMEY